jgi:hypothetical protein
MPGGQSEKQASLPDHLPSVSLIPSQTAPENTGDDHGYDCFEGVALSLLYARAPAPQVLEISAQFSAILFFHAERRENGRNCAENNGFDIVAVHSLLRLAKWKDTTRFAVVDANPASGSVVPGPRILSDASNLNENVEK